MAVTLREMAAWMERNFNRIVQAELDDPAEDWVEFAEFLMESLEEEVVAPRLVEGGAVVGWRDAVRAAVARNWGGPPQQLVAGIIQYLRNPPTPAHLTPAGWVGGRGVQPDEVKMEEGEEAVEALPLIQGIADALEDQLDDVVDYFDHELDDPPEDPAGFADALLYYIEEHTEAATPEGFGALLAELAQEAWHQPNTRFRMERMIELMRQMAGVGAGFRVSDGPSRAVGS